MLKTMNNLQLIRQNQPSLVLDPQNNLIRIHRNTLRLLKNPEFIQIMINPRSATIAIKSCNESDYRSERIKWEIIKDTHCCEFYSKVLIKSIVNTLMKENHHQKYYIQGHFIEQENLAVFHMKEMNVFQEGELI